MLPLKILNNAQALAFVNALSHLSSVGAATMRTTLKNRADFICMGLTSKGQIALTRYAMIAEEKLGDVLAEEDYETLSAFCAAYGLD